MTQLKAGYFSDAIKDLYKNDLTKNQVDSLCEYLSFFDVQTNIEFNSNAIDPITALIDNMISRGTPSKAPQFVEDILSTTMGKTIKKIAEDGSISRTISKDEYKDLIFRALHVIEPREKFSKPTVYGDEPKKTLTTDFLYNIAVNSLGKYIVQLAQENKNYEEIFAFNKNCKFQTQDLKKDENYKFLSSSADLYFNIPYSNGDYQALTFGFKVVDKVDTTDYLSLDKQKEILNNIQINGEIIVKNTDKEDGYSWQLIELENFAQNKYFDYVRENYLQPLYKSEDGIEAMQIALTPCAVARVQKIILESINAGILDLKSKQWDIAVIERDVPCAFLAIEDLKHKYSKLYTLENQNHSLPKINLEIYYSEEFANTELNLLYQGTREEISEFDQSKPYDLMIDISMLQRFSTRTIRQENNAKHFAIIKTIKSIKTQTQLKNSPDIFYDINIQKEDEEDFTDQEAALLYFLKEIFRKNAFLDGQIETITALLNGKNLLKVGQRASGKTLSTLFACMLKPGYSFVLCPNANTVKDQFNYLRSLNIETCYFVNPALTNTFERDKAAKQIICGNSWITFMPVSLLHDNYIRTIFRNINQNNIPLYNIIVDQIEKLSLQSLSYNPQYQDIKNIVIRNFSLNNIGDVRIGAFSSSLNYSLFDEICEKLDIDCKIIDEFVPNNKIKIKTTEVKVNGDIAKNSLNEKRNITELLIDSKKKGQTLVLTNQEQIGLEEFANLSETEKLSLTKKFKNGQSNLLQTTIDEFEGINHDNLKHIIFFDLPLSLEEFYKASLCTKEKQELTIDVLFNTRESDYTDFKDNTRTLCYDLKTNLEILRKNFPGPSKEKTIMSEIINGVFYPPRSSKEILGNAVYKEFNQKVELETEPMVNPYQIYIYYKDRKSLGHIDFNNNTFNLPESNFDKEIANKIQTFVYQTICNNNENPIEYLYNMETPLEKEEFNGVQTCLDLIKEGEEKQMQIGFVGSGFFDFANVFNKDYSKTIGKEDILEFYENSASFNEFADLLNQKSKINILKASDYKIREYKNLYQLFRSKKDTFRAVFRLKEIGIIEDYLINNSTAEIVLYLKKYNKTEYLQKLLPTLKNNLTKEKTINYITSIEELVYLNVEKYTNTLIDFFYAEIFPNYQKQMEECDEFFYSSIRLFREGTLTNQMFMQNLTNYFVSKYNCNFVKTKYSNPQNVDDVISTIKETKGNINQIKLLLQASSNGENISAPKQIIAGFCKIFVSETTSEKYQAYNLICQGLNQIRQERSVEEFKEDLSKIKTQIVKEDKELEQEVEELTSLKLQLMWLKRFNFDVLKIS